MVRKLLGPDKIIGVSADTLDEALAAQAGGADYIGIGAVYNTVTKGDAGEAIGIERLRMLCDHKDVYIGKVAIGGISADRVRECLVDGHADGVAVVSAIFGAQDVRAATLELGERIAAARRDMRLSDITIATY